MVVVAAAGRRDGLELRGGQVVPRDTLSLPLVRP